MFIQHVWGGLKWVLEGSQKLDYSRVTSRRVPEENRFTIDILDWGLFEPTELEVLNDFRVIFTERGGRVKLYDPERDTTIIVAEIDVYQEQEDGLMSLAIDPEFEKKQLGLSILFSARGRTKTALVKI